MSASEHYFIVGSVRVQITQEEEGLVIDCCRQCDASDQPPSGPRFWLSRLNSCAGWKLFIHPHADGATHCIVIPDEQPTAAIYGEHEVWPE